MARKSKPRDLSAGVIFTSSYQPSGAGTVEVRMNSKRRRRSTMSRSWGWKGTRMARSSRAGAGSP